MGTLFILSHAPHTDPNEGRKLAWARAQDSVLLIEDAVYGAGRVPTPLSAAIETVADRGVAVYALEADVRARGIEPTVPVVDYGGAIDLIAGHERSVH